MKKLILVVILMISMIAFGHGDHHHKNRLPPAPHGGSLEEAHKVNHNYQIIVFYEIKKTGNVVKIYPLMLSPDSNAFNAMNVAKLGKPTFKLKDPRKKKEYTPELKAEKDHWSFSLKGISGRRFIVDISTSLKENKYHGFIQFD